MTLRDKVMQLRRHVIQRAAAGIPVTRVCGEAGISRTLFYRWKQRYLRSGDAGVLPRPARPRRWGRQRSPALEHAVLASALHCPTHGPARIADQLRQRRSGGWRLSATGAYQILRRHGLRTRWERLARLEGEALGATGLLTERTARRLLRHERHLEAERPGDLVCLDSCSATSAMAGSSGNRMQRATPIAGSLGSAGSSAIHARWFTFATFTVDELVELGREDSNLQLPG
jgi:hypothetical protein